jgi:trigger factor
VLGSGSFIPGFESQLEGAAAGEERTVDVTFPEDYHNKDLAGRAAQFQVSVEAVAAPQLPDVDADFMAAFGVDDGVLESFRADVRSNMERELRQRIEAKVKSQVMDALLEANPLVLPAVLVSEEIGALKQQTLDSVGGGNVDLPDELFAESAERRVKLGLVIAEVVKQHDLRPSPERVRALVEELAATYERPEDVINYYYADPQRLSSVEALALEELVVERMLATASVEDEASTFAALTESGDASR